MRYQPSSAAGEDDYVILSNPRKTFIPPPGHGFLPRDTAWHHQQVGGRAGLGRGCFGKRLTE